MKCACEGCEEQMCKIYTFSFVKDTKIGLCENHYLPFENFAGKLEDIKS